MIQGGKRTENRTDTGERETEKGWLGCRVGAR